VKVSEVMRREVATVQPHSPITEAIELLLDKEFAAVPVIDEANKLVGMVRDSALLTRGGMEVALSLKRATDAEFARQMHESLEDPQRKVSEVVTREVVTISPEAASEVGQGIDDVRGNHRPRENAGG
jgi:CBS domain-containing protein